MIENLVFLLATLAGPIVCLWSMRAEEKEKDIRRREDQQAFRRSIGL
jgi:hypothetical protein